MNREQMVEKAADLIEQIGDCESAARAVLDAALPLVTTVAELEALPKGSKLLDGAGLVWEKYMARSRGFGDHLSWRNTQGAYDVSNGWMDRHFSPLTVVWQPEPETGDRS